MSAISEIERILSWYKVKCEDCNLAILMASRDKLSVLSYDLAKEVAIAQTNYNSAYFIRRISVNRTANNLVKEGLAVNKANLEAIEENQAHYQNESTRESEAFMNNLLLKQVNQVLAAMQQRISLQTKELQNG